VNKQLKNSIVISMPILCALAVSSYFGYEKYLEKLKSGNSGDPFRWAVITGLFVSPIGFVVGLILGLFVWMIVTANEQERNNVLKNK
jgi:hypothetical protein